MSARVTEHAKKHTAMNELSLNQKARNLAVSFCLRNGVNRSHAIITKISSRYFNCLSLGYRLTPDRILLYDLKHGTHTSDIPYTYDGLIYTKGKIGVLWSTTDEFLENIEVRDFNTYQEYRDGFIGELDVDDENRLRQHWNNNRPEKDQIELIEKTN